MFQDYLQVYKVVSIITVICSLSCVCNVVEIPLEQFENNLSEEMKDIMEDSRPNIVLIEADDLGWGDIGTNWPKTVDTPFIDYLAKTGLRLTDFHSGASVCAPSRAALLTGRLGLRTGVVVNFQNSARGGIPENETTLGEILQDTGYRTSMLGKWHLGTTPGHHPLDKGFQSYLGVPYSLDMGCTDPPGKNLPPCPACPKGRSFDSENLQCNVGNCFLDLALPLYRDRKIVHQPVSVQNLASMYADFARKFIIDSYAAKSPYFLYVALSHIHVPLAHSSKFDNITGRGIFFDTLQEMDWLVRRIFAAVNSGPGADNTLIWFISDNGPWAVKCDLAGSVGPFTGDWQRDMTSGGGGGSAAKQTVWEGGHRVPSILHWPARIKAGLVSDALMSAVDIMPTITAVTNSKLPLYRHFDGQNMISVITGDSQEGHKVLFHPNSGAAGPNGEIGAIRVGAYKVVYYSGGSPDCMGHAGPARQYFDSPLMFQVVEDPAEKTPISPSSAVYHDIMQKASQALSSFLANIKSDNTSVADYSESKISRPCCNTMSSICRCPWD